MSTKITDARFNPVKKSTLPLKSITLESIINLDGTGFVSCVTTPLAWENIQLLYKGIGLERDLIMCWDNKDTQRFFYLGHWNDGVI